MQVTIRLQTLILSCLLFLNSCTVVNMRSEHVYVDSQLADYVARFAAVAKTQNVSVNTDEVSIFFSTINMSVKNGVTVGYCYREYIRPTIIIDQRWFQLYNESKREVLLFHELGHCLLHRKHCDVEDNHQPISLMTTYVADSDDYSSNREAYLKELFHADKRCR